MAKLFPGKILATKGLGKSMTDAFIRQKPKVSFGPFPFPKSETQIGTLIPVQTLDIGGVPTTPDPNTSAKISRYKWEAYRDTNWRLVHTTFCQGEGILLQKYRDRNGRCIATLFKSIGVRGRLDSPEVTTCVANYPVKQ